MNLSTVALLLLAWHMLSSDNTISRTAPPKSLGLADFLSDDIKGVLNNVSKLTDKNCSAEDRTGAIFQMMSNPAVVSLANNLFAGFPDTEKGTADGQQKPQEEQKSQEEQKPLENDEGYRFETPSAESQEFFRPIDNIADAEVKHKLYWFYENWYIS